MLSYIQENKDRFLNELLDLLRIPSVSTDANHKNDMLKTAQFLSQKFQEAGVDKVEICPTNGHRVVLEYHAIAKCDLNPTRGYDQPNPKVVPQRAFHGGYCRLLLAHGRGRGWRRRVVRRTRRLSCGRGHEESAQ